MVEEFCHCYLIKISVSMVATVVSGKISMQGASTDITSCLEISIGRIGGGGDGRSTIHLEGVSIVVTGCSNKILLSGC